MNSLFRDRAHAGQLLAPLLHSFARRPDAIILALPRGGVVVGHEVARKLHLPLDVLVVRKLGVPGQEECAMGAIASGGVEVRDLAAIAALGIPETAIAAVVRREQAELARRELAYRARRAPPRLADRTVILVDDGIATGCTMRAAIKAAGSQQAREIVVAVPVASAETVASLRPLVTEMITVNPSMQLGAVGLYYHDFRQVTDDEVIALLDKCREHDGHDNSAAA